MKRKLLPVAALLAALATAIMLTGCTYAVLSVGNRTSRQWTCTFQLKGGTETHTITIPEGESPEIRFDLTIDEGTLNITVKDSDGETVHQSEEKGNRHFTVALEKAGNYSLSLNADKLSGSYDISWGDPPDETEEKTE